ncbi:MAG TPA: oligosaccharide flippase family protein [Terracidiphilus sp.]|nr:oligosaccharide flippase family protein [Terracidiphilus sp.]
MTSASLEPSTPAVVAPPARRGFRAVLQSIASKSLILALQAGTGILTARILGPSGRGELAAMILWPLFIANTTTFGVPSSLIYYMRCRPKERDGLATNGFLLATVLGLAAAAVAAVILPWWLHRYSASVIRYAECFLFTVPLCSMTLAGRATLEASHDFSASNTIQTLTPLATLVVLLLFFAAHSLDPYTAAIAYIVASLPSFLLMLDRIWRAGLRVARIQFAVLKRILGYGIRSYGIDILGTLALQVDQVLVVSLLSARDMGSYVVVLSISRMLNVFQTSVVMVLFPKAAGRSKEHVLAVTGSSVRISVLATAVCGAAVCIAGPDLLRVVYGPEYAAAAGALRFLVLEAILSGMTFVLAQAFMALNRPGVVTVLQALGLSLCIPMMLLLIPRYGIDGAVISLLVSTTARFLFVCAGFGIFLKTRPPRLVPGAEDLRMLGGAMRGLLKERTA